MSSNWRIFWYDFCTVAVMAIAIAITAFSLVLAYIANWVSMAQYLALIAAVLLGMVLGLSLAIRLRPLKTKELALYSQAPVSIALTQQVNTVPQTTCSSELINKPPYELLEEAILGLTQDAVTQCFCRYCHSEKTDLSQTPYDPNLHDAKCPVPLARQLVRPIAFH